MRTISKQVKYLQTLRQAAEVQIAYEKARNIPSSFKNSRDLTAINAGIRKIPEYSNDYSGSERLFQEKETKYGGNPVIHIRESNIKSNTKSITGNLDASTEQDMACSCALGGWWVYTLRL